MLSTYHLISGGALILAGAFIAWMALAGRRGTLKPNHWVGVRTAMLMSSDEKWVAGHKAAATPLFISAAGTVFAGVVSLFVPFDVVSLVAMAGITWLTVFLLWGVAQANTAAKRV